MCLKAQSPPPMASQSETERPLNPNAQPFYGSMKLTHQELGFPKVYGHFPIPSIYPPSLASVTYYSPPSLAPVNYYSRSFGISTPMLHPLEVAQHSSDCCAEQQMEKNMIANTKRPPRRSQQKRNPTRAATGQSGDGSRWRPRKRVPQNHNTSVGHPIIPFPTTMEEAHNSRTTTVMIKNIPYHYQRENLLLMLDKHCVQLNTSAKCLSLRSTYDFVYLPMDYKKYALEEKKANLGYAFVNFTTARGAFQFFEEFNGYKWADMEKWKACEVTKAQFQGKELLRKFEKKTFRCVCPSFRPVEFRPARDGVNSQIKEIWVGKYAEGLPHTSIGRSQINKTMPSICRTC